MPFHALPLFSSALFSRNLVTASRTVAGFTPKGDVDDWPSFSFSRSRAFRCAVAHERGLAEMGLRELST
jgi:hypothetical protein